MAQEGDVQEADEQPATATEEVCDYPQTDISDNSYDNPLPPGQVYNFGPFTFSIEEVERPADDAIRAYADMMAERGEVVETDPGDGLEWLKFVIQTYCGTPTPIWNTIEVEAGNSVLTISCPGSLFFLHDIHNSFLLSRKRMSSYLGLRIVRRLFGLNCPNQLFCIREEYKQCLTKEV